MEFITDIITTLQILTLSVVIPFGIYLVATSNNSKPTIYIGLFLIAFTTDTITTLLVNFEIVKGHEYLYFLPLNFWFLSAALLYIYTRELTRPLERSGKILHLLPGFTEFIILSVLFIFGLSGVLDMSNIGNWHDGLAYYFDASVVYALGYYILISWTIRKTRKSLVDEFSNVHGRELKWLEVICYMSMVTMLSWVFVSYVESVELFNQLKFIVYLFNTLTISYIMYNAIRQRSLGLNRELYDAKDVAGEVETVSTDSESTIYLGSDDDEVFARIKALMENEKLYLDPDLKLHDLAQSVKSPSRKLSQLIQAQSGSNFRSFVNQYRVKEAKNLLKTELAQQLTMEAIAYDSGFNSRATFYSMFKKFNGCSPAEYRNSH